MAARRKKSKNNSAKRNALQKSVCLPREVVNWLDGKASAEARASGATPNFSGTLTRVLLREKLRDQQKGA